MGDCRLRDLGDGIDPLAIAVPKDHENRFCSATTLPSYPGMNSSMTARTIPISMIPFENQKETQNIQMKKSIAFDFTRAPHLHDSHTPTFPLSLLIPLVWCALGLAPSLVAWSQPTRYALLVSSVSGDEESKEKFWNWSSQMVRTLDQELKFAKENVFFLNEDPKQDRSAVTAKATRTELSKTFDRLASAVKADDLVFIFLLGHASFDNNEYKFNLVGPDVTGSELKAYLDRFSKQRVVLVCATPCSGILAKLLSQRNRVIITATKNEFENNDTIFAQFLVEAFKSKTADTDKNNSVSLLEAFSYASQKVDAWYKEKKLLATEHPLLEDNGDGKGTSSPSPANGEGLLASVISLEEPVERVLQASEELPANPELQPLYAKKHKLETALQELKYKKPSLAETEYNKSLEDLLVQLAQINQKIKSLEKK